MYCEYTYIERRKYLIADTHIIYKYIYIYIYMYSYNLIHINIFIYIYTYVNGLT